MEHLRAALRKMSADTAGGLDGWRVQELQGVPERFHHSLLRIYRCVEDWGVWPEGTQQVSVSLLTKKGPPSPTNVRPIAVTPIFYRLWAIARWSSMVRHQESWIHDTQHGFRPGRSAAEAALCAAMRIEHADATGQPHVVVDLDLSKAFDTIPRKLLWHVLQDLGIPSEILRPWQRWYEVSHS